jgi:hypothetical protein
MEALCSRHGRGRRASLVFLEKPEAGKGIGRPSHGGDNNNNNNNNNNSKYFGNYDRMAQTVFI